MVGGLTRTVRLNTVVANRPLLRALLGGLEQEVRGTETDNSEAEGTATDSITPCQSSLREIWGSDCAGKGKEGEHT